MAVKIVLVDDQPVPGLALRRWLKKARELEVVGEAVPGSPVLALIQITEPDVVLLDVLTSPEAGLNVARLIRDQYPELPIVAIGEAANGSLRAEAAAAGAWAYFPKRSPEELPTVIRSVIDGKGKNFLDLTPRVSERPLPVTFIALPDDGPQRSPVEPQAAPSVVAAPRRAAKPMTMPSGGAEPLKAPSSPTPQRTTPAKREAPARNPRDAVAWVAPSLQPAFEEAAPKKARERRKKKHKDQQEVDLRGPTGLPRRFGGHR
jgi:DNA-binding NarL/FixJ family response regulator